MLRYCIICSSNFVKEVAELAKQGKNFREIREFLAEHGVQVWENSVRYHLLFHPEKPSYEDESDEQRYWRWCEKFGRSKVDPYWIKSGRKILKVLK